MDAAFTLRRLLKFLQHRPTRQTERFAPVLEERHLRVVQHPGVGMPHRRAFLMGKVRAQVFTFAKEKYVAECR